MARNDELDRLAGVGSDMMDAGPSVGSMGTIEQVTWRNAIFHSRHPLPAFFHVAFKSSALVLYFLQKLLGLQYVTTFVLVVLLMAADFWVVKNLSGRLLVGLRWWSKVVDGKEVWVYESAPNASSLPALDRRIFWWPTYLTPVVWGVFALLSFISLSWEYLPLHIVAAGLSGSNALGYIRCSGDAQRRLQASFTAGALSGLASVPGALPALGSSMLALLRTSAAGSGVQAGATAPGVGVGAGQGISDFDAVAHPFGREASAVQRV